MYMKSKKEKKRIKYVKEDIVLISIVKNRDTKNTSFISHDTFWSKVF